MNKNTNTSPSHHGARSRNCVACRDQAVAKSKMPGVGKPPQGGHERPSNGKGDLLTQRRRKRTQLGHAVTTQGTSRRLKSDLGGLCQAGKVGQN